MKLAVAAALCLALFAPGAQAQASKQSDDAIAKILIEQSIARYPGTCACPYSTMRNGRSCGGRSAYSKPGGHAPLCYPKDVSKEDIERYRKQRAVR